MKKQLLFCGIFLLFACILPKTTVYAVLCPAPPTTGNYTLSNLSCAQDAAIEGPANGDMILDNTVSYTLGQSQVLVFYSGYKVVIGGGTINKYIGTNSGQIVKGTICLLDHDNDGYPASISRANQKLGPCNQILPTDNWVSRASIAHPTLADCDDSNALVSVSQTCYPDTDGDGHYSNATTVSVCAASCAAPNYSATAGDDCCDTDIHAYLGSTYYGTTQTTGCSGGGGFDYDCDGNSNDTSETTDNWWCENPCVGCSNDYAMHPGWQSGAPGCGQSANRVNATEPYIGGTCYTVASCNTLIMTSSVTMGCK